jgi:hypothetical protein
MSSSIADVRGARTQAEVVKDFIAATETKMSRFGFDLQTKYHQLLSESDRHATLRTADHPASEVR